MLCNVTFMTLREYTSDFRYQENVNFSERQIRSSSQRILILFVFFQAETCRHFQSYTDSAQRGTRSNQNTIELTETLSNFYKSNLKFSILADFPQIKKQTECKT